MSVEAAVTSRPDPHVHEVIRSAERELYELLERRAELMKRIEYQELSVRVRDTVS